MMHKIGILFAATALFCVALSGAVRACDSQQANTGVDDTLLTTSVALSDQYTSLSANARSIERSIRISDAISQNSEFVVDAPYRNSLAIDGMGSAAGWGDLKVTYVRRLSCSARWRTAAILGTSLGTGNINFTSARVGVEGGAVASYGATKWLRLVFSPSYAVPVARAPGLPVTRTLMLTSSAIAFLPLHLYAAASMKAYGVAGDYRYNANLASFTLGNTIDKHYGAALFFEMPIGTFTYEDIQRSAVGFRLMVQR